MPPPGRLRGKRVEHGHAHGDAHFDLLVDHAPKPVGDQAVDLDAPVHGAGMHHQGIGLGAGELFLVEPEHVEVFAGRGHEGAVHAFKLQAQHHDDVAILEPFGHVGEDLDAETVDGGRQER